VSVGSSGFRTRWRHWPKTRRELEVELSPKRSRPSPRLRSSRVPRPLDDRADQTSRQDARCTSFRPTSAGRRRRRLESLRRGLCSARGCYGSSRMGCRRESSPISRISRFSGRTASWSWDTRRVRRLAGSNRLALGYGSDRRVGEERLRPFGVAFLRVAGHRGTESPGPERSRACFLRRHRGRARPAHGETEGSFNAPPCSDARRCAPRQRGSWPIVDTRAFFPSCSRSDLRAVLDVTDPEPLPADHPLFRAPTSSSPPHIAAGRWRNPSCCRPEHNSAFPLTASR